MNMPSIGSKVSITVRVRDINLFAPSPYKNIIYNGNIIKSQKWVNADSFSIETTDKEYPVKIIPSEWVTDIKIISGTVQTIRKFQVKGIKGTYIVTQGDKQYSCTCIGFKYRAKCKHITAVVKKQQALA
jgi:hypothetical protein